MADPRGQPGVFFRGRRAILEGEDLTYAPREVQEAFWRRYNQARRSAGRRTSTVAELSAEVLSPASLRAARRLRRVAAAWEAVVPAAYRARSRVDSFVRGRLCVAVDGKATGFVLGRQMYNVLLAGMNARLSGFHVERIEFRVDLWRGESAEKPG